MAVLLSLAGGVTGVAWLDSLEPMPGTGTRLGGLITTSDEFDEDESDSEILLRLLSGECCGVDDGDEVDDDDDEEEEDNRLL